MTDANTQSVTHINTNVGGASLSNPKRILLSEQTVSTLLVNIGYLYRHHFGVVIGCVVIPFVPLALLLALTFLELGALEPFLSLIRIAVFVLAYIGLFVVVAALTVVISDICLGNAPTPKRAFSRVLEKGQGWHLFITGLVLGFATLLGMVLLIVPGLWVFMRSLFTSTIVVLEDRRGTDAIRRSFALTKGQVWRMTGLYFLTVLGGMVVGIFFGILFAIVHGIVIGMDGPESGLATILPLLANVSALLLTFPMGPMTLILLYYDQRVRRESYDVQALSEDLMR